MNTILFLFLMSAFILNASEDIDNKNIYSQYGSCEIPLYNDLKDPVFVNLLAIASKKTLSINLMYGQDMLLCTENHYPYGSSYAPRALVTPLVWDAKLLGITNATNVEHLKYDGKIKISSLIGKSKGIYRFDNNSGIDFAIS